MDSATERDERGQTSRSARPLSAESYTEQSWPACGRDDLFRVLAARRDGGCTLVRGLAGGMTMTSLTTGLHRICMGALAACVLAGCAGAGEKPADACEGPYARGSAKGRRRRCARKPRCRRAGRARAALDHSRGRPRRGRALHAGEGLRGAEALKGSARSRQARETRSSSTTTGTPTAGSRATPYRRSPDSAQRQGRPFRDVKYHQISVTADRPGPARWLGQVACSGDGDHLGGERTVVLDVQRAVAVIRPVGAAGPAEGAAQVPPRSPAWLAAAVITSPVRVNELGPAQPATARPANTIADRCRSIFTESS